MTGQPDVTAIRALEEQRRLAMLAADTEALEAIFDESLIYIHSTGARDTRASYLAKLTGGAMRYESVSLDVSDILVRERFALLSGAMAASVQTANGTLSILSRYEASWIRSADGWRIAAMQSFIA
ncbi:nuclear transport factor 2 family protein [Paraburkholderia sp. Ac-20340]|uniref:nuclear transport factor 2 family protein n=1 Tax=Paraburkholderia sp. Ac-20340 TaxID=2703888 RepID=UPI00197FB756|nr:nuclear transport factor 2 family protein [Paraburkholderia sp. Ac-20340]MBN3857443.1 nuclear transport factor 2 family protein [Paraburkholderia sp. Ac-20340]